MFIITRGKGFAITLHNGYQLSVQFGMGNYCHNQNRYEEDVYVNRSISFSTADTLCGKAGCESAEIAIIGPDGNFCGQQLGLFEHDDVEGWVSPSRVVEILTILEGLEP